MHRMRRFQLDHIDQQILRVLQADARISHARLAALVGLSPSACRERVLRLERCGVIHGYQAILSTDLGGGNFEGWVMLSLANLSVSTREAFEEFIAGADNVDAAYETSGAIDFLLHFVAESTEDWRSFCVGLAGLGIGSDRICFGTVIRRVRHSRSAAPPFVNGAPYQT